MTSEAAVVADHDSAVSPLKAAATAWLAVAAVGQAIFAAYVIARVGPVMVQGRLEDLNKVLPHAYVPGDASGNLLVVLHLALAAVVMVGGVLQLIPGLRRRWPVFHRWNGWVYIASAVIVAAGGLFINLTRGIIGGQSQAIAVRINALLIIGFAVMALHRARARRIDLHRRWALRLFLAAGGVWFGRIGLSFWILVNQGPVGYDPCARTEKYTLVAWHAEGGKLGEGLICTPLRELAARLDPTHFVQVHRSVVVNLRAISHVTRGPNETADIYLKGRPEVLPVSRSYLHLFRHM